MARIGLARDETQKKFRILEPCQISKPPERQKNQNFGQALVKGFAFKGGKRSALSFGENRENRSDLANHHA
jgi:hypothetical protein